MNNRIQTYNDLLKEEKRLETLLQYQKNIINRDMNVLKHEIMPAAKTLSILGKMVTGNNQNVLVARVIYWLIDRLFKKLLLSRSGCFTKRIVPFFLKIFLFIL